MESTGCRTLRVGRLLAQSRANGPGTRAVIWLQGCTLGCPGCFNPELQDVTGGREMTVDDLMWWLDEQKDLIEGLTISGGEPLRQPAALLELLTRVRDETTLGVVLFTGLTREEVERIAQGNALIGKVDVLLSGRYKEAHRLARGLRGSANKEIHLMSMRYSQEDFEQVPIGEVIIGPEGEVTISGIDPLQLQ